MPRKYIPVALRGDAAASGDSRSKWKRKKREPKPKVESDSDSDEAAAAAAGDDEEFAGVNASGSPTDPVLDSRESELLVDDGGTCISVFPYVATRVVNRPHSSVLAVVAAERSTSTSSRNMPFFENISHGQLQVLSAVLPDNPSLAPAGDTEKPSLFVCTPAPLMEGKGVAKQFPPDRLLLVPKHSDWFSPISVHRLERQVVPHFFTGKSSAHSMEKYIILRNKIISKYLDYPGRRLAFADCQGLVGSNSELYDLSRIVRFLDNWGIINYFAIGSVHRGLRMAASLLREEPTGELQLLTAPLKSIDSLILFDRPKCSIRVEELASLSSDPNRFTDLDSGLSDLDARIRERLTESTCSFCSQPLPCLHYQSQKEADIALCSDCFHDAKYITGHSSLDFVRMDVKKDSLDSDGDNWTDQETLLLLEGVEKYNENWTEISEHVGTKSKAQCMHHFIRLPVEDSLWENIELPMASASSREQETRPISNGGPFGANSINGVSGSCLQASRPGNELPFSNAANPVMSLVAFLGSAIGPRVAASCANAALCILTNDDPRVNTENMHAEVGNHGAYPSNSYQNDGVMQDQLNFHRRDASAPVSADRVKYAAMCGLSAAAMKSKLFADQEEREVQRLAATIINHQLKRLELKLKQFAEIETLLMKECEQVERVRQRIAAERVRMLSGRMGPPGSAFPGPAASVPPNMNAMMIGNQRPQAMAAGAIPHGSLPSAFGNSMQQGHPQAQFLQAGQQMLSFGPRLPLSAIHPPTSGQPANVMFNSVVPNTGAPNHHSMLRPPSGNTSNIG